MTAHATGCRHCGGALPPPKPAGRKPMYCLACREPRNRATDQIATCKFCLEPFAITPTRRDYCEEHASPEDRIEPPTAGDVCGGCAHAVPCAGSFSGWMCGISAFRQCSPGTKNAHFQPREVSA